MAEVGGSQDGGQAAAGGVPDAPKGVLLAIAIVLLWLAGFCFFIAFEGSKLLTESSGGGSASMLRSIVNGLAQKSVDQAAKSATAGT